MDNVTPAPIPPTPYLAHPYPLQDNFTGRREERNLLTTWAWEDAGHPLLSLVGMGGMGKSVLAWYWMQQDLPQERLPFTGIIWWSFYERDAGFDSFADHALVYASSGEVDPKSAPSDYDRLHWLLTCLYRHPFLVILDGVERLLRAYARLDAPYQGDDRRPVRIPSAAGRHPQLLRPDGPRRRRPSSREPARRDRPGARLLRRSAVQLPESPGRSRGDAEGIGRIAVESIESTQHRYGP